jgi:hypothetical protein
LSDMLRNFKFRQPEIVGGREVMLFTSSWISSRVVNFPADSGSGPLRKFSDMFSRDKELSADNVYEEIAGRSVCLQIRNRFICLKTNTVVRFMAVYSLQKAVHH